MKQVVISTLLLIITISCSKSSSSSFSYAVNGITNITVRQLDTFSLPIQVEKQAGTAKNVSLAISGLPTGLIATITPDSGKPNYNAVIKFFADQSAALSTTLITLTASSSVGNKPYNFNISVLPFVDCSSDLVGTYVTTKTCTPSSTDFIYQVITTATTIHRINIANFGQIGSTVYADLNCDAHTLNIPSQSLSGGFTVSGSGSWSGNNMTINYSETSATTSSSCTMTMAK